MDHLGKLAPVLFAANCPADGYGFRQEWKHQLRSSLHPLLFATIYYAADAVAQSLRLSPTTRAGLLIAAPKATQAGVAALGDFFTWKLARRIYGSQNNASGAALALTVLSPWQWFCSTRTFSNCLETTLTVVALYAWPWQWSLVRGAGRQNEKDAQRTRGEPGGRIDDNSLLNRLRLSLSLAALACVLRPTNVLIWTTLATFALLRSTWSKRVVLFREALACGSAILALTALADRLFYGAWTFPPLNFVYFNIAQSLAVFYGVNNWHYYISQGYPLLLTTALPFAVVGLYRALTPASTTAADRLQSSIKYQLATVCLVMPFALSLISHKEVRFIYPLLPCLHVLTSPALADFFAVLVTSSRARVPRTLTLLFLLLINAVIALYTSVYHESGPVSVLSYLRDQHQIHSRVPLTSHLTAGGNEHESGITVGFLMPCHSTPWRSHMVYPSIHAWALTCEPPINLNATQKACYLDEADQFYDNVTNFLQDNMMGGLTDIPRIPSYSRSAPTLPLEGNDKETASEGMVEREKPEQEEEKNPIHPWPDYLAFFAQLEPTLQSTLRASSYAECWRTWSTAWHHDWRRKGDVVVWCLDPLEQQSWRSRQWKQAAKRHETERSLRERQFDMLIEAIRQDALASRHSKGGSRRRIFNWPWRLRKRATLSAHLFG